MFAVQAVSPAWCAVLSHGGQRSAKKRSEIAFIAGGKMPPAVSSAVFSAAFSAALSAAFSAVFSAAFSGVFSGVFSAVFNCI